jgi:hypothetical protein
MLTVISYRSRDHRQLLSQTAYAERCVRVNRSRQKYDKDEEGVETIVSLNTELEVAIPYLQPLRLTATAVAERLKENACWLRGKKRSNSRR